MSCLEACVNDLGKWISSNRPKFKTDKTQYIGRGIQQEPAKLSIVLAGNAIHESSDVTVFGVVFDSEFTVATHVKRVAGRCFYQLHNHLSIRNALTTEATKTVIRAFISSPLCYCNSVFSFVKKPNIHALSSLFLMRLLIVMRSIKYDHISYTI